MSAECSKHDCDLFYKESDTWPMPTFCPECRIEELEEENAKFKELTAFIERAFVLTTTTRYGEATESPLWDLILDMFEWRATHEYGS